MKKLCDLLENVDYEIVSKNENLDIDIEAVWSDNRKVTNQSLFVCIIGANFDGHSAIKDVIKAGAKAVVISRNLEEVYDDATSDSATVIIKVLDTRLAYAQISATWFSHPARKLKTIGITGTKGKTTTTYLVKSMLENAGYKVGLVGTIEAIIGDEHIPALNTTPESYVLQEYFSKMVEKGLDAVVMEVSSQALMMHRSAGFTFDIGVFTNLEPDHIGPNEHKDFDDYLNCKSLLFRQCKLGIVNGDDEHIDAILKNATCKVVKYGFKHTNDIYAQNEQLITGAGFLGVEFDACENGVFLEKNSEAADEVKQFKAILHTPGRFSIMNALCAISIAKAMKVKEEQIVKSLKEARVKGRIEIIHVKDEFTLMIDYAHNAMALQSLLTTLKEYSPKRLVCLFGCGGNRSKLRRFEMGEVSGNLADLTVITSDNPRFEKPLDIIADIRTGIEKTSGEYIEIPDRREAIKFVIENGRSGDVIVLAGKGHEDYQEIEGKKYPMDERVIIQDIKKELGL